MAGVRDGGGTDHEVAFWNAWVVELNTMHGVKGLLSRPLSVDMQRGGGGWSLTKKTTA